MKNLLRLPILKLDKANEDLNIIRNQILQIVLYCVLILGAFGLASSLPVYFQRDEVWMAISLAIGYGWTLAITLLRIIPYRFRAVNFLAVIYLISVIELIQNGISGEGRIFLLALLPLTLILLGLRAAAITMGVSLLTLVVVGFGMVTSRIPLPGPNPLLLSYNSGAWINGSAVILIVGIAISGAVEILSRRLENALQQQKKLAIQMDTERDEIATRLQDRNALVDHRLNEIRTVAEINRSISGVFDLNILLQQVIDQILRGFDLYYTGIFLVEPTQRYAVLRAGTGEAGQKMIANHHRLAIDTNSMIGWAVSMKQPRIALDIGQEAVRFNNPYLPQTRSEMALPIISRSICLGALTIQSSSPNAFDQGDIAVLQGIADGLAVALENVRLYEDIQKNLQEIKTLNRQYLQEAWLQEKTSSGELSYTFDNPLTNPDLESGNTIEIPITIRDQIIGRIAMETGRSSLLPEEQAFVNAITTQTALALENARLLAETQRHASKEEMLNQMSSRFSRAVDVDTILRAALQELGKLPSVSEVSVHLSSPQMLADEEADQLSLEPTQN